jgi:hypothetical protein
MKLEVFGLTSVVVVSSALGFSACAAGGSNFTGTTGGGSPAGSGGASTTGSPVGPSGTGGNPTIAVSVTTGGPATTGSGGGGTAYAYAHTNTQLYQFDPNAATLAMTLVGTFDCIGGSSSSSTSSGGSSGGPTTCAEAGGSVGCCIGNTEYYCSSGGTTPTSKTCTGGEVCTWEASKSYYGCATGSVSADPSGTHPIACGGGSSSTSSTSSSGGAEDSSMTDIAVDSAGDLWGVSEHYAYELTIEGSTVHCAKTISLMGVPATFYGLSFVPKGLIDADAETLVASDTQGDLWRIDQTTGALEQHGNFGTVPAADPQGHAYPSDAAVTGATTTVGTPWQLSGDIVFLAGSSGNPAVGFATVRDCTSAACSDTDTLLQIDTTKLGPMGTAVTGNVQLGLRGQILKSSTCTDTVNATYGKMFGIAAWNSTIYGFSHDSYIVEISNVDGSACVVGGNDTTESWSGAAVTTIAPVKPPPPPPPPM